MRTILLLMSIIVPFSANSQVVLGYYYGNYAGYPHNLIEFNCLTHIAHAFVIPKPDGSITYDEWFPYPELVKAARENGTKIVVSVGGWGQSDGFKPMASDPVKRSRFVKALTDFVLIHGYDGADIDWEYPKKEDKDNYTSLITELRASFDSAGVELLSAALPAIDWNNVFDIEVLKEKFDWFGIMTYDFYGPWEKQTGLNTALYSTSNQQLSVNLSIKHYLDKGVPEEKLLLGMEFAGYIFNAQGLYKTHKGGRSISYVNAIKKLEEGWEYNWDELAKVPWLSNKDSIITVDDTASIRYKTDYIIKNKLGGVIIWKLGLDYRNDYNEFMNIIGENYLTFKAAPPIILSPLNNELIEFNDFVVLWERPEGAGTYTIEISASPDFNFPVYRGSTKTQSYIFYELELYTNYFLRVRSELDNYGEWSDVISFSLFNQDDVIKDNFILDISNNYIHYNVFENKFITIKLRSLFEEEIEFLTYGESERGVYKKDFSFTPDKNYHYLLLNNGGNVSRVRL